MMYASVKHSFWEIRLLASMRIEMGSLTVKHKGEKNHMGFNTTCMSHLSSCCVTFMLVNATLLNEYESSYFQFLSNCLFLIMPGEEFRELLYHHSHCSLLAQSSSLIRLQ